MPRPDPRPAWSRGEILALAAILLLAAVLRMGWPGLSEFKADEARLYSLALAMSDGEFAVRGISSSVGFPNFPMSVWLYSLPLLIWPHPYAATLFTGLLNTLAVAVGYWLARRYWGVPAALAAALMWAVSPWAIIYSRKIWAQNLLPLFVVGWGASAALAYVDRRRAAIAVHVVCLAVAVELHLAAAALVPATLLLLLIFRRRVDLRWLLFGGGLALLTVAPFLVYLLGREPVAALSALGSGGGAGGLSWASLRYGLMVNIGSDIHSLAGPDAFRDYLALVPGMALVHWLWAGLLAAAIVWMGFYVYRRRATPAAEVGLIWLIWLAAPVLFFLIRWTEVYPHYLIATFPAAYLIAGAALAIWLGRASRPLRIGGWLMFGLSVAAQLYAIASLLVFLGGRATPGGFGTPLSMKVAAADRARVLVESGAAAEVIVAGRGQNPEQDEFPAEYAALLAGVPHRFADLGGTALFPAAAAVVLLDGSNNAPEVGVGDLYRSAATAVESVPLRAGEGELALLTLPPGAAPAPNRPAADEPLLANWVRLLGTSGLDELANGRSLWRVHWRTADNPDPADYHFFNHLLDADGARVAQVDAAAFDGDQWRPGDVVVSQFVVGLPVAARKPLLMRVGMYRYPDPAPIPLLDVAANPYADALDVPLLPGE